MWIDYIACTGDGWNPTYSIASCLAASRLCLQSSVSDESGLNVETRRGDILILGGNLSYPRPEEYQRRLIFPFDAASQQEGDASYDVFALPGERDRYDELVSFSKVFCSRRQFASWRSSQENTYFALKLPHRWWLLGTDIPIYGDIDKQQAQYFQEVAAGFGERDRIILCNTEPHWTYAKIYEPYSRFNENNLAVFETVILKKQVSVYIAGGFHYYSRHEAADGTQKITSGGGGAFLHPTHVADISSLLGGYEIKALFPSKNISRKLSRRLLSFPLLNPSFGTICALFYLITWWFIGSNVGRFGITQYPRALKITLQLAMGSPGALLWILLVWCAFLLFTETHSKSYRMVGGSLHALLHFLCIFLIGWFATFIPANYLHFPFASLRQLFLTGVIILILGGVVGPLVMGLYLYLSLNVFGRHSNEAFAALAIPDWKSFVRLKIDSGGNLTIFPIGIRRVPRKWKPSSSDTTPAFLPDDTKATDPELIESPIMIQEDRPNRSRAQIDG